MGVNDTAGWEGVYGLKTIQLRFCHKFYDSIATIHTTSCSKT